MAVDGPAAAAAAIAEVVEVVQAAAKEHEVCFLESDVDADGARIVLVAGAPRVSEHDVERMLRTVRAAAAAETRLPLSIGTSRGRVFAGEVGASFRRTYTILGGTAALAARLMARADAAADSRSRRAARALRDPLLDARARAARSSRASRSRCSVVALGAIERRREAPRTATEPPLVDRQRELAVLDRGARPRAARLRNGARARRRGRRRQVAARCEEFRDRAADLPRIGARCDAVRAQRRRTSSFREPAASLVGVGLDGAPTENAAALRRCVERVAPELVPWIPLLALPLDVDVASTNEVDELAARVPPRAPARSRRGAARGSAPDADAAALRGRALDRRGVVGAPSPPRLDDMTRAVGDLLHAPSRQPRDSSRWAATPPVAGDDDPARSAARRRCDRARRGGGGRRARRRADRGHRPARRRQPALPAGARHDARATDGAEDLPETVDAVVGTRIDKLAPADRALLRWASVLGVIFDGDVIADVLEDDPGCGAATPRRGSGWPSSSSATRTSPAASASGTR